MGEGEGENNSPPLRRVPALQRGIDLDRFKAWIASGSPCSRAIRAVLALGIFTEVFFVISEKAKQEM